MTYAAAYGDHTAGEAFKGSADPGQYTGTAKCPINFYKGRYDIMAKVGLKDTLALLAKGYSKKDIDELAAIDEAQEAQAEQKTEEPAKNEKPQITPEMQEQMNELLSQIKEKEDQLAQLTQAKDEAEAKVTKLQQANVHSDSTALSQEAKAKQEESLLNMVRGFM